MYSQLIEKYGFITADERCISECRENPLIIPRLYRYRGMGLYEIVADVKDVSDRFFLFDVGGPNGYEYETAHNNIKALTLADTLTVERLHDRLLKKSWVTVITSTDYDDAIIMQECHVHQPDPDPMPLDESTFSNNVIESKIDIMEVEAVPLHDIESTTGSLDPDLMPLDENPFLYYNKSSS